MLSRFKIHRHKTNRTHFDLRLIHEETLRSWSMLKQPPIKSGERRLAIERETLETSRIDGRRFEEQAFGEGGVYTWDEGDVALLTSEPDRFVLEFHGGKLVGRYELRRMRWYPGNRWLLAKI